MVNGGALLGCVISLVYFVKADRSASLAVRGLTSAFGLSLAIVFITATFLWPKQYRFLESGVYAFYWLQAVPLLLLGVSLAGYPGPHRLHRWLVPVGLLAWLWTFAWGWLFVHGE
jgi:hypothetical protein